MVHRIQGPGVVRWPVGPLHPVYGCALLRRKGPIMNDTFIFVFGLLVTAICIGPLALAAYLDSRDKEE